LVGRLDRGQHVSAVVEALDIAGDDLYERLRREVPDEVGKAQVCLVSQGHHVTEADTPLGRRARQGASQCAAVGNEGDIPKVLLLHKWPAVGGEALCIISEAEAI